MKFQQGVVRHHSVLEDQEGRSLLPCVRLMIAFVSTSEKLFGRDDAQVGI